MASPPNKRARVAFSRPLRTWCTACISRLFRDHSHRCYDQKGAGGRCSACAHGNCKSIRLCENNKPEAIEPLNPAPEVFIGGDEYLVLIRRAVSAFERIANAMEIIAEGEELEDEEAV
ncbi:hypothetical protein KVR01_012879 [Diaporthe batatas]|uniref:uncharacterized protein n=1 Tax=Diaporthe batatas TaxID=748121 RepID=UPI001D03B9E9|nr:uncharacterized protein KVR01_012879 [Diaporthe batatas]KAG8157171.1 hypothetical protein KVR01_012879 [Diaporthe batatas]